MDEVTKRSVGATQSSSPHLMLHRDPQPTPGLLFSLLNRRRPDKVRRRFSRLYWKAWGRTVQCFFLLMFGLTFFVIGTSCMFLCDETSRAFGFMLVSALMLMPGVYSAAILLNYLRLIRGFSYKDLPG